MHTSEDELEKQREKENKRRRNKVRERAGDKRWLKKMEGGDKETHIKGEERKCKVV